MRTIFSRAKPVDFIFEAFGGIGKTAQVMRDRFPDALITSTELDQQCVDQYNSLKIRRASCVRQDALVYARHFVPTKRWGASLDYNMFTIMDVRGRREGAPKIELLEQVMKRQPVWVQITDSAIKYLHLNYKRSYRCRNNIDSYADKLASEMKTRWGLKLQCYDHHHAATYFLFYR